MKVTLGTAISLTSMIGLLMVGSGQVGAAQQPPYAGPPPAVVSGAGDITAAVEQYRNLLGPNNGGDPGSSGTGRREINWDDVSDELSAPNFLPPDFFNAPDAPRARGAFFSTPGSGVQVSADSDNPFGAAPRFAIITHSYSDRFTTFS